MYGGLMRGAKAFMPSASPPQVDFVAEPLNLSRWDSGFARKHRKVAGSFYHFVQYLDRRQSKPFSQAKQGLP
ncbi:MAG: hypothetical protein P8Z69_00805 [Acidihalobacter sp.]